MYGATKIQSVNQRGTHTTSNTKCFGYTVAYAMAEHEIGVYGHSDDLIEIVGDVREEYYANFGEPTHVRIGDTEVVAEYTSGGEWKVSVVDEGVNDTVHHHSIGSDTLAEEANDYTEAVLVETDQCEVSKID